MPKKIDVVDSIFQKYDGTQSGLTSKNLQDVVDEMVAILESIPLAFGGTWEFDSVTTEGDPGAGKFRMNASSYAATTEFYFDEKTVNGIGIPGLAFPELVVGQRFICVQGKADSPRIGVYEVSAPAVDNTTYWTVPATHIEDGGASFFQDGKNVTFNFWGLGGDVSLPEAPDDESRTYFREGTTPDWTKELKGYGEHTQATLTTNTAPGEDLSVDDGNVIESNLTGNYFLNSLTKSLNFQSATWMLQHNGFNVTFPASFIFPSEGPPSTAEGVAITLGLHPVGSNWRVTYVDKYGS